MHAMKTYGGVNLEFQLHLTLVLDASELSTSHTGGFICENELLIIIKYGAGWTVILVWTLLEYRTSSSPCWVANMLS
jgi:hypothetical protein